jgi:CubicO group peptidase (beta-lactamase class C family)
MSESGYDRSSTVVKNRASGYTWNGRALNVDCEDVSLKYAAGGLYSTVEDLYKWDQALYTNQLVSKDTLNKIFTSSVSMQPGGATYGYGWIISRHFERRVIEHSGAVFGFETQIMRYPDDQVTVIVLSNTDFQDPVAISVRLAGIVFGGK